MSRLSYVIPVWGGCESYLISALQIVQNNMMRTICRRGRMWPVRELLKETGWLSVRQLSTYHSLIQIKKILSQRKPTYLYNHLVGNRRLLYARQITRNIVITQEARLSLTQSSWRWRTTELWKGLPEEMKKIQELKVFKSKLRNWVKDNIEI